MNIRNICLLGHGGEGKTSLAESMLFSTGGTDRLGKVADGNTVCDFDPEEIRRKISISATPVPVEFGGNKLNVIDTPGYFDFSGEVLQALRVADTAVVVASAKGGVGVGAEKVWKYSAGKSRFVYVSKVDEENANFTGTYEQLREKFGISLCPVVIPASQGDKVTVQRFGIVPIFRLLLKVGSLEPPSCGQFEQDDVIAVIEARDGMGF